MVIRITNVLNAYVLPEGFVEVPDAGSGQLFAARPESLTKR